MKPIRTINNDMFNIKINKDYKVYLLNTKALQEYPNFFNDFMNSYIKKLNNLLKNYIHALIVNLILRKLL